MILTLAMSALSLPTLASETSGPADLTGRTTLSEIEAKNYSWWKEGIRKSPKLSPEKRTALKNSLSGTKITIYFGTWCSDSQEHVPAFVQLLKDSRVASSDIQWHALNLKKTYPGFTDGAKIERIPTFIFYRNGEEVLRIVETPKKSLAEDMLAGLTTFE